MLDHNGSRQTPMPFSVLISIYHGTLASDMESCLKSLVDQHLQASQIILVRDGPVRPEVEQCIASFSSQLPFEHLSFENNRGLGLALRDGLTLCCHELVARVDSDDRSMPDRFALQIAFLKENPAISVVGGWMREHYCSATQSSVRLRKVPIDIKTIARYARRRNPLNHPTVMFRKSHALQSGGYQSCHLFEDYFLWARMLMDNYRLANLPVVLVDTQIDPTYFERRGGVAYLCHEFRLLKKLKRLGFFSQIDAIGFIIIRLPMRLVPVKLRKKLV